MDGRTRPSPRCHRAFGQARRRGRPAAAAVSLAGPSPAQLVGPQAREHHLDLVVLSPKEPTGTVMRHAARTRGVTAARLREVHKTLGPLPFPTAQFDHGSLIQAQTPSRHRQ
jgi:hypothetical protein